jgi:hypothetical protein
LFGKYLKLWRQTVYQLLSTKQLKQEGKLDIAEAKRQGRVVATDGTITGSIDSTKEYYRTHNVADLNLLPTKYSGDDVVDNTNLSGLVSSRHYRSSVILNDLDVHLDAGDKDSYGGSGTTVTDLTSNSLNATLVNGVGFSDFYWTLDGNNDYIRTANLYGTIGNPDTFSQGVWIYPTAEGVVCQISSTTTPGLSYHFANMEIIESAGDPVPHFGLWNGTGITSDSGSAISYNTWWHMAQTYNAATNSMKGYINGSEVASATVSWDSPHDDGETTQYHLFGAATITNMGDGSYYNGRMSRSGSTTEFYQRPTCRRTSTRPRRGTDTNSSYRSELS